MYCCVRVTLARTIATRAPFWANLFWPLRSLWFVSRTVKNSILYVFTIRVRTDGVTADVGSRLDHSSYEVFFQWKVMVDLSIPFLKLLEWYIRSQNSLMRLSRRQLFFLYILWISVDKRSKSDLRNEIDKSNGSSPDDCLFVCNNIYFFYTI